MLSERRKLQKISIAKAKKKDLIHFAFDNAANFYKQQIEIKVGPRLNRDAKTYHSMEVPKRMECIDISIQEKQIVASNVVL